MEHEKPADHILQRRQTFSFIAAPKGGEIDSEVCDQIGQMCALGLLVSKDRNHIDPAEMRDKGRFWGAQAAQRYKMLGAKVGSYERRSRSSSNNVAPTKDELLFDRMDENLWDSTVIDGEVVHTATFERKILWTLLVDPLIGCGDTVDWAQSLIDFELLERKRLPPNRLMRFPTAQDSYFRDAAIRGLEALVDGALPSRWNRVAA